MSYSDEPVLVTPARRWSVKTIAAILVVAAVVGGILYIPLYQHNLDEAAHHVDRGPHHGSLYRFTAGGTPHEIEIGWVSPSITAFVSPAPAPDATLDVDGNFGRETLTWDSAKAVFGPGKLQLNPYNHHKVKFTLRQGGRILWADTLWAYGAVDSSGHHH